MSKSYQKFLKNFIEKKDYLKIFLKAFKLTQKYKGNKIELCTIINAKSGKCPGDCKFCAQSLKYNTSIKIYPLLNEKEIISYAKKAKKFKVKRISLVTSGIKLYKKDILTLGKIIENLANSEIKVCASLGILKLEEIKFLKDCGLGRLHCNLETSESFFPKICTTHNFRDKVKTVETAKNVGLSVCSGGIFGIGESWKNRIELAITLKKLEVDSVPLNFLIPIKGTPLESQPLLPPIEALKIISLFRLILPEKDIRVAGGRLQVLKDFSSWIFLAGANALITGDYLTTKGRSFEDDLKFVKNHGLKIDF